MNRSSTDARGRMELDFEKDPRVLGVLARMGGLGVFTLDAEARIAAWSEGAARITGHAPSEMLGHESSVLEGPDCKGFSGLRRMLLEADADGGSLKDQECRVLANDGSKIDLLGSAELLVDDDGNVYGAVGQFVELTQVLHRNGPAANPARRSEFAGLIGAGAAMEEVFRRIQLASDSDVTTLVTGDSGTGKELAARAIHDLSDRAKGPFRAINCSALSESLLESELFGHVRGAFTGAVRDRVGLFEAADEGTLFLDEIGDVSPLLQVKLLRVLQEREIQRVGGEHAIPIDVRVVSATNRELKERIASGAMREDFYYRIRVFEIRMPPLRERTEDLPLLARFFLERTARANGKQVKGIARDALEALVRYSWPGNVRELQNVIEYAMVVQSGDLITLLDLPEEVRGVSPRSTAGLVAKLTPAQEAERGRIVEALEAEGWNRTRAAVALGVSRVTLWKKMRRYRIDEGVFRRGSDDELGGSRR